MSLNYDSYAFITVYLSNKIIFCKQEYVLLIDVFFGFELSSWYSWHTIELIGK